MELLRKLDQWLRRLGFAIGWCGLSLLVACDQSAPGAGGSAPDQLYTCGMHPQVIQNKPGNCPICGMKLTPVRKDGGNQTTGISVDPVMVQNMGFRSGKVERGPLRRVIRSVGVVDFDETTLADVTTKFRGWIEKLHVDATGKQVHRGEPLFEIYSPELFSAQVEYLLALAQSTNPSSLNAETLRMTALTKLRFFDVSEEQIAELGKSRQPRKALPVLAPRDGVVVEKMAVEGQMVETGMKLYRLADLGLVWVISQVYEQDIPFVKLGQEAVVTLSYLSDRQFRGRVTHVYPTLDDKTRTARVRMEFHNPGFFLKPGMFATVELRAELEPSALLVPDSAVLRSGAKNTVFVVAGQGHFEPRTITLGPRAENDRYQVLSGLSDGETVVTSGQFMLDSESQLREGIQKMLHPAAPQTSLEQGKAASTAAELPAVTNQASALRHGATEVAYICPMPEHVSVKYQHPGKCPICGMGLVPVSAELLEKIQPGARVEYYACPMPEDAGVRSDKSGKCPRCGMTLIPVMEDPPPKNPDPSAFGETSVGAKLFTCPMEMHADVVADKPGRCLKCEMKLVPTETVSHGKVAEANWRATHAPAVGPAPKPGNGR